MKDKYLKANVGTNHRGIAISKEAMKAIKSDNRIFKISVNWNKTGLQYQPYQRWEDFWKNG